MLDKYSLRFSCVLLRTPIERARALGPPMLSATVGTAVDSAPPIEVAGRSESKSMEVVPLRAGKGDTGKTAS
jgi:hypothetical protein